MSCKINKYSLKIKIGSYFCELFTKIKRYISKLKLPRAEYIPTVNSEKIKILTLEERFLTPKNFYREADVKIIKTITVATFVMDENN